MFCNIQSLAEKNFVLFLRRKLDGIVRSHEVAIIYCGEQRRGNFLTVNNILTGCRTFILAEGRVTR
jgi:hypothetical protein